MPNTYRNSNKTKICDIWRPPGACFFLFSRRLDHRIKLHGVYKMHDFIFFWPHRKFCNDAFAITTESNSTVFCSLTPNSVYWLHYAMIRSKNKIDSFTYTLTHTNTLKIKPKKIKQMSSLILNTIVSSKFYVFQILINFSHCVCQPKIHNTSKSQQKKKKIMSLARFDPH